MEILGSKGVFIVGNPVAEADEYRLYSCWEKSSKRQCLFQIAKTVENNGSLDRAAYILGELKQRADELEIEYAEITDDPKKRLNYSLGFPELVDSFVCSEQGGRKINVLAFRHVDNLSKMVPLSNITVKDQLRVDLRTSAWIMGKLFKLLAFAHSEGILPKKLTGENILIEPDQHYVLIFDWSSASTSFGQSSDEMKTQEISDAAKSVIAVLGGDPETGVFPDDGEDGFAQYTEHLLRLARGSEHNAGRAHKQFYELVEALWGLKFHVFTSRKLTK
jgi:serine/threonine protein kinase